jgi:hypothetical protein
MYMQNIGNCAQNVFCYIEWEKISMIVSLYQSVVSVYTRDKTESNDVQSHVPDLCTGIMQAQNSQSHPDRNTRHCAEKNNKDSSRLFLFWIQRERQRCKGYVVFVLPILGKADLWRDIIKTMRGLKEKEWPEAGVLVRKLSHLTPLS